MALSDALREIKLGPLHAAADIARVWTCPQTLTSIEGWSHPDNHILAVKVTSYSICSHKLIF